MLFQIIFLIILILLNAYFAASEMAYISLNDAKIEKEAKEGNKKAKKIKKMLKNPSKFLATIQIGITLAGFLSSAFAADTFASELSPILNEWMPGPGIGFWQALSIIVITIILSFFTLIFGELVPKRLAMKYSEKIAFSTIGIISFISVITSPFVKLLTATTNLVSKIFGVSEYEEEVVTEEEIKIKKRVRDYLYGAGMTEIIKEFGKKVIIEHLKKKLDSVEAYSDYFWGILREIYDLQKEG